MTPSRYISLVAFSSLILSSSMAFANEKTDLIMETLKRVYDDSSAPTREQLDSKFTCELYKYTWNGKTSEKLGNFTLEVVAGRPGMFKAYQVSTGDTKDSVDSLLFKKSIVLVRKDKDLTGKKDERTFYLRKTPEGKDVVVSISGEGFTGMATCNPDGYASSSDEEV